MMLRTYGELTDDELCDAEAEKHRRMRNRATLRGFDGLDWSSLPNGEFRVRKEDVFRQVEFVEKKRRVRGALEQQKSDEARKERMRDGR